MKNILLTGATGFFGKNFLNALGEKENIFALTRDYKKFQNNFPNFAKQKNVEWIEGDILNFKSDIKFDFIIHGATETSSDTIKENPLKVFNEITEGTKNILEIAKNNPFCKTLILSSGAVYGKIPNMPIKEEFQGEIDLKNHNSFYAEGKKISEMIAFQYHQKYNLSINIARCFAFAGKYLPVNYALSSFISKAKTGESIVINSPDTIRSYMAIEDAINWLLKILPLEGFNVVNVGSDKAISILSLAELIVKTLNSTSKIIISEISNSEKLRDFYIPDISLAKEKYKLQINCNLEQIIKNYDRGGIYC